MRRFFKYTSVLACILYAFFITSCGDNKIKTERFNLKLGKTTAVSPKDGYIDIYNLLSSGLNKTGRISNVTDLTYDVDNGVYIYLIKTGNGTNLQNNKIRIEGTNYTKEISSSFSALDIKLSKGGDNLVYRSFGKDDLNSAEGLKIYSVKNNKKINFNSRVLVSGNMYQWIDDSKLLYYGILPDKKKANSIFLYDVNKGTEKEYFSQLDGYCTFFQDFNNKTMLYLESDMNESRLCLYDEASNSKKIISKDISEVYSAVFSEKTNDIFFSAMDKDSGGTALYKLSLNNYSLSRITFDFPKEVDKLAGLSIDESFNVYFCGISNPDNSDGIYMLNSVDQSINLLSTHSAAYKLFSNSK